MNVRKAAIVRVHINDDDDDRVTSCVKMRICQQREKRKKKSLKSALPEKADPAEPSPMNGERDHRVREEASWPWNTTTLRRHFVFVSLFRSVIEEEEEEEDTPPSAAEVQRTKLSTSTKLSHSFISSPRNCHRPVPVSSSSRAPYDTPHIATCCLPHHTSAPPFSQGKEKDCLLLCAPVLRACVRACVRA